MRRQTSKESITSREFDATMTQQMMDARDKARQERARRAHMLRMVQAASTIQRWWRNCRFRRDFALGRKPFKMSKHTRAPSKHTKTMAMKSGARPATEGEQEIAALVIQLAWRRHVQAKLQHKINTKIRTRSELLRAFLNKQRTARMQTAYLTMVPEIQQWTPTRRAPARFVPLTALPSPAITSFNMAVSIYRSNADAPVGFEPSHLLQSINERFDAIMKGLPDMQVPVWRCIAVSQSSQHKPKFPERRQHESGGPSPIDMRRMSNGRASNSQLRLSPTKSLI